MMARYLRTIMICALLSEDALLYSWLEEVCKVRHELRIENQPLWKYENGIRFPFREVEPYFGNRCEDVSKACEEIKSRIQKNGSALEDSLLESFERLCFRD
jgi:hypothetical protein